MAKQQGEISTLSLNDAKQKIALANLKKENSEFAKSIKTLEAKLSSKKEECDANLVAEINNLKQNNKNFKLMLEEKSDVVKRLEKSNKEK
jgi:predicted RNase H-like nuclease (RuvC/YqgF family)